MAENNTKILGTKKFVERKSRERLLQPKTIAEIFEVPHDNDNTYQLLVNNLHTNGEAQSVELLA